MASNPFLTNNALKEFVDTVGLREETKNELKERISQLDEEQRITLFETLVEITQLDMEEKEALSQIDQMWQK